MTGDWLNVDVRNEMVERYGEAEAWQHFPHKLDSNMLFMNDGSLHFSEQGAAWGLDEPSVTFGAVLADLDRDGDLDIVTNNFDAPAHVYEKPIGHRGRGSD